MNFTTGAPFTFKSTIIGLITMLSAATYSSADVTHANNQRQVGPVEDTALLPSKSVVAADRMDFADSPNANAIGGDPAKVGPWTYRQTIANTQGQPHAKVNVRNFAFDLYGLNARQFPRLHVSPKDKMDVVLSIPGAKPGDAVTVEAADGGDLGKGEGTTTLRVGADGNVTFAFVTGTFNGIYHLLIRSNSGELTLPVWAGPLNN